MKLLTQFENREWIRVYRIAVLTSSQLCRFAVVVDCGPLRIIWTVQSQTVAIWQDQYSIIHKYGIKIKDCLYQIKCLLDGRSKIQYLPDLTNLHANSIHKLTMTLILFEYMLAVSITNLLFFSFQKLTKVYLEKESRNEIEERKQTTSLF